MDWTDALKLEMLIEHQDGRELWEGPVGQVPAKGEFIRFSRKALKGGVDETLYEVVRVEWLIGEDSAYVTVVDALKSTVTLTGVN